MSAPLKLTAFDRFTMALAPRWTLERLRARMVADAAIRGYQATQDSRRTDGWRRQRGDIDSITQAATSSLAHLGRDLVRNNGWAKRAQTVIVQNVIGGGIVPRAIGPSEVATQEMWNAWANSTECDADGRNTMSGLQKLMVSTMVEAGEVLIRRRYRRAADGLKIPLQLQVLEPDFIDSGKDGIDGPSGGPIVQGVEFDKIGRRVAYWLFPEHPGNSQSLGPSVRVPASDIIHQFKTLRAGQTRGLSWLATALVTLKSLDTLEDAELMKAQIAACFAAFVTDEIGSGEAINGDDNDPVTEMIEPGAITSLPPGKKITFGNPPTTTSEGLTMHNLRKIAASLDVTYEDLSQDYSKVNFSSARMARLSHWASVEGWQWDLMVPVCGQIWGWAMAAAALAGKPVADSVEWTTPQMPMLEPDKEARAGALLVRAGMLTPDGLVRQQGLDPKRHWDEYQKNVDDLKARGIVLDSLASDVSQAGLTQQRAGAGAGGDGPPAAGEEKDPAA